MRRITLKYLPLFIPLSIVFLVYILNFTRVPLWFDEAVEYFYSKYMIGVIPGETTTNMYQRIVSTYQPPLYNVVMYLWLLVSDKLWWFRLLGVITTLLGCIGFYYSILRLTNSKYWGGAGILIYGLTPFVACYAFECAEYNLMMAFISWALYYFICCITSPSRRNTLIFLAFSTLAVYSQYGAAIIVTSLFVTIVVCLVKRKDYRNLRYLILLSAIYAVIFILPLIVFFTIPQLQHQGTTVVSHSLHLVKDSIWSDIPYSIYVIVETFMVSPKATWFVLISLIIGIITLFIRNNNIGIWLYFSSTITFVIYYILTATSLYGYNSWAGSLGTNNLGGRYELFMIPLLILTFIYSIYLCASLFQKRINAYLFLTISSILALCLVCRNVSMIFKNPKKTIELSSENTEIVNTWFNYADKNITTVVFWRKKPIFLYYIWNDERYQAEYQDNIHYLKRPTKSKEQIVEQGRNAGMWDMNQYYLILDNYAINYTDVESELTRNGYEIDLICPNMYYVRRSNINN